MPCDGAALLMRLPRQLNNPQAISRKLRFDPRLALAVDRIHDILIVRPVRAVKAGVLANVELALLVILLRVGVNLALSGQGAPDARIFFAEVRVGCGLAKGLDGSRLLGVVTVL